MCDHTHGPDCLAGNELDEICCSAMADKRYPNSDRWIVPTRDGELHTFTDSAEDAIALAEAHGDEPIGPARFAPVAWPLNPGAHR